jgi:non-ribosomal peptide synthase protein (TIGR01720 family)
VLHHLEQQGPALQAGLNQRTTDAVAAINDAYRRDGVPIHVEHFSSFFRPTFQESTRFAGLFQYYLRERGIHTNPPSPSFLSTVHTEAEIAAVVDAYTEAGREMARGGFFEHAHVEADARAEAGDSAQPAAHAAPAASAAHGSNGTGGTGATATTGKTDTIGSNGTHGANGTKPTQGETSIPLLPNVARFLVERNTPDPDQWNLGVLLQRTEPLDAALMAKAVDGLIDRHEALRMRFHKGSNGWEALVAPTTEPLPFSSHDLSALTAEEQRAAIERQADEMQRSLSLQQGPLLRVASFDLGPNGQRLLVIVHHFAMDGLSWRPFWDDFDQLLTGLREGQPRPLPPEATSFTEWAHRLKQRADSAELRGDVRTWLDLDWEDVRPIPLDHANGNGGNTNESAREVVLEFSVDETRAIFQETPGVPHKVDFLLTALSEVAADWTGSKTVLFDMMGHGRDEDAFDDVDLFETVGFFISYTPMVLTVGANGSNGSGSNGSGSRPKLLTDQIQPIMRRGLDFDLLRYMTSDATVRQKFSALPRAQILFNHLGKRDELDTVPGASDFSLAAESIGNTHAPSGIRYYPIAISSQVWKDQLRLNFVYSENLHTRTTVEALAEAFRAKLLGLVAAATRT